MGKIFLDANIIIDFLDDTRKGFLNAQKILAFCVQNDISIGISEDIMTTVFYICKKNIPREKIFSFFSKFESFGNVEHFGSAVRKNSLEYCLKNNTADLEDVLQSFCAQENKYDAIITNDKNFPSDILQIYTAPQFLKTL